MLTPSEIESLRKESRDFCPQQYLSLPSKAANLGLRKVGTPPG